MKFVNIPKELSGIYLIYNTFQNIGRVGESKDLHKRAKSHYFNLLSYHPQLFVDNNFHFIILEKHIEDNKDFRLKRESFFIDLFINNNISLTNTTLKQSW